MAAKYDLSWLKKSPNDLLNFLSANTANIDLVNKVKTATITYSFYDSNNTPAYSDYSNINLGETPRSIPFTDSEKITTRAVLNELSTLLDINFKEVLPGQGLIRYNHANMSISGYANYPNQFKGYENVFISDKYKDNSIFISILLHETGHALGLKHPGNYDSSGGILSGPFLPKEIDNSLLTVMSYNSTNTNLSYAPLDIATLIYLYGASQNSQGIEYRFITATNPSKTNYASGLTQTFQNGIYTVPIAQDSVFWVVGTKATNIVDLSNLTSSPGFSVDANFGRISLSSTPSNFVNIYDDASSQWTTASVSNFGNINVYPIDGSNTFSIGKLLLGNTSTNVALGNVFNEIITGSANDTFVGFAHDVKFDAGEGIDTWKLPGSSAEYKYTKASTGFIVTNISGQSEKGFNIEKLQFENGLVISDIAINTNNSDIYRLYQAAFARSPDEGGFRYWIEQHDSNNQNVNSISSFFISSQEFKTKYGSNLVNSQFVDLLYQNVLGRSGEAGGTSYWNNELNNGHQTKDQVLLGFAISPENVLKTAANIDNGYWLV